MRFRFRQPTLAFALILATAHAPAAETPLLRERTDSMRPQLMLVGAPHFGNPHQDISKTVVPDVMSPARQAEVERVARALAAFKPTKVMVEVARDKQARLSADYLAYLAGKRELGSGEHEQLGMRVAAVAGLKDLHAVDWNKMPPGKEEDFDWEQWSEQHGKQALLARIRSNSEASEATRKMAGTSVAQWLIGYNQPESLARSHRRYFDFALLGDNEQQPGANWVANWYGRNLKIFARIVELAAQPGDRILVIYGAGHIFPLREFALQSGGFTVVDPLVQLHQATLP
jgi:hypothetical protein